NRLKWMETFLTYRDGEILEFIFSTEGKQFLSYYAELPHSTDDYQNLQKVIALQTKYKKIDPPLINGNDLMNLGYKSGPNLKKILKLVYYHQLEKRITDRDALIDWTKAQKF